VFPTVEGLLRDTGFSNQGYHGFTAEHPVDHFPSEMWRVLVWHVIAPFEAHHPTTLINNGQYLGVTSFGPKKWGHAIVALRVRANPFKHVTGEFHPAGAGLSVCNVPRRVSSSMVRRS